MKPKPFIFTKRYSIPSIFSRYFPFSTHNRHSFDDSVAGCSAVYRHALQFQRPATIRWSPRLENSASFIGSVTRELARVNSKTGYFGVHTVLRVRISSQPNSSYIRVLLMMRNSVAELALEHLKPNDFIYASGSLWSYTKPDAGGIPRLNYKLDVKEFKFVTQRSGYQGHKKSESAKDYTYVRHIILAHKLFSALCYLTVLESVIIYDITKCLITFSFFSYHFNFPWPNHVVSAASDPSTIYKEYK
ncbi:uncharacterized protein LOC106763994 isoform X2 [Vigna radiata var. radiata]|uniref:Uncharacterized protein LOC106763994 isoform X2 n=1 Tax=Vigna radiata var. radiata TaxID=3916 RepID=A0A3Q0F2X1_VIGRR|nr:uncharacterized protein LOC106763994 isoform X2 [Vigna radiata var. radiata]